VSALAGAYAYRALFTLGARYDLESGVEYWLFVPNDRAPAVVLALAAWLAWRRWPRLSRLPPTRAPGWLVGGVLGLGSLVYLWSIRVRADDLQAVALMLHASGLLMLGWGVAGLRVMWVPVAFLLFCIPIPSPLLVTILWELRLWTAEYTGWLLYLLGIPSLVSGDQILRAAESFQVVEGCSGLRSTETLTMLVVLLVDLFQRRGLHAALLLVSAPLVAFALNGVRVLTLTLNPHSEIVAVHSLQGIAILLVGLLVVYGFDGVLARVLPRRALAPEGARPPNSGSSRRLPAAPLAPVALAVAGVTLAMTLWVPGWGAPRPPRTLVDAVDEVLTARGYEEVGEDTYFYGRMHFREIVHRSYPNLGSAVEVFVGNADLRDRRTSIVSWITAVPGSGWLVRDARDVELEPGGERARELVVEKGTQRRLVLHRLIGVQGLATETLRSFLGLDRSEFQRSSGQLAVRLSTRLDSGSDGRERAAERLRRYYGDLAPALARVAEAQGAD